MKRDVVENSDPASEKPLQEKKKKGIVRRIIKRTLWTLAILTGIVSLAISVAIYIIFTPERITPIALKYANEYLVNAKFDCKSVELTFYSTFPNFGIRLQKGYVVSQTDSIMQPHDTLLAFNDFTVSFDMLKFYNNNQLLIHRAQFEHPVIYACVDGEGKTNWDILPTDDSDTTNILSTAIIKNLRIVDADIIYDNLQDSIFIASEGLQMDIEGTMTDIDVSLFVNAMTALYGNKTYSSRMPLILDAHLTTDSDYQNFVIDRASMTVGILEFDINGTIVRDTCDECMKLNIGFNLQASSLADLLSAIPAHIFDVSRLSAAGQLDFSGRVEGVFGNEQFPVITASLIVKDGRINDSKANNKPYAKNIEIDFDARIDKSMQTVSYLKINTLKIQNDAVKLNAVGVMDSLLTTQNLYGSISSDIDFAKLMHLLPSIEGLSMTGRSQTSLETACSIKELLEYNPENVYMKGDLSVDNLDIRYLPENIAIHAPRARIHLGSNVTDTIRGKVVVSFCRAIAETDDIFCNWDTMSLKAGKMFAKFHISTTEEENVFPFKLATFANLKSLQVKYDNDSLPMVKATEIKTWAELLPRADKPDKSEIVTRVSIDSLRYRLPDMAGHVYNSMLSIALTNYENAATRPQRQFTAADSAIFRLRRDSIQAANKHTRAMDFQLAEGKMREFITTSEITGTFKGGDISCRTPLFPLRMKLTSTSVKFTTDKINILSAGLRAGSSTMRVDGNIEGIRRALLRNGRLKAAFNINSDSINCNELIRAMAVASQYADIATPQRDSIRSVAMNDLADTKALVEEPEGIFVVPRNLDLELNAKLKRVQYGNFNLTTADGKIIVRDGSVRIPELKIRSDIGNADMSIVYKAPTIKGAYVGLDMNTERVQVGSLVHSLPILDSLAPMLNSIEGVVACRLSAVTELDSLSNVVIPKSIATCNIKGKNMVLLDGETFSKIAKKLYFKNKNRNIIDSIAVEFALVDNSILVFPFVMSIDRYVAAIGGTQNLDMSFRYHVSILKWPVPLIKPGLNIWGTPEDIHYSMASRKFADLDTPVKTKSLQSSVINLRQNLNDAIKKSIDNILNEKPLTPRFAAISESELFSIDTTEVNVPVDTAAINVLVDTAATEVSVDTAAPTKVIID